MTEAPRISPLPESEWPPEVREYFRDMEGLGCVNGEPRINVPLTLANHLALGKAFQPFGGHLLLRSSLPKRIYELVTLRTAAGMKLDSSHSDGNTPNPGCGLLLILWNIPRINAVASIGA
jgi:hypothetical protein